MPTASAALPLVSATPNAAEPASLGTTYAAAALPQVSATPNAAEPASSGTTYAAAAPPHVSATPNAAEPASLSTTYTAAASPQVSAKPNAAEPASLGTTNAAATPSVFKATPNAVELASLGRGYAAAAAPLVREPVPFGATYAVAAPATDLPLPSLRERTWFYVGGGDVQLLPCGLVLVADWHFACVKLYTTQGQHLRTRKMNGRPWCLVAMDTTASDSWMVATSIPNMQAIVILDVSEDAIRLKSTIQTPVVCEALTAVGKDFLAVGYSGKGIDLLDMSGQVLRRLSDDLYPITLTVTPDRRFLVMSTVHYTVAKVRVEDGATIYNQRVDNIVQPSGVAVLPDSSYIVTDMYERCLHLVSPDGLWERELWRHPQGDTDEDPLERVCVSGDVCLASVYAGPMYVFGVS